MAFASVGSFGTANSTTSGTTLALTPTVTIEAGNLAMLVISADNVAVGTSPNAEFGHKISNVSSVTDTGSNVWHKLGEVATNQAADAGNAVALYYSILTTQLTTGSTVTVTFGAAITSKAASGWEFTIGGSALAVERIRFRGTAGADPPSMTLDDLTSREYLFFRARASETDSTAWTSTTDFTPITNATADAGAAGVGSTANGEFRIITSTSQTSDPTKTSNDGSDIFIALWEGSQADASPWVVTGNTLASGAGTTTPAWPLGHEVDDIALLVCESLDTEAVTLTTANGFAEVTNSPQSVSASRLTVFWCRATSTSMAAPVTNDPGDHVNNHMYLIRGCHNSGNPWDVTAGDTGASSTSVTVPQVTTTVNRCLILWICSQGTDISSDEFSGWANTGSTRFEELDAISTTAGNGGGHGIAYGYKATAGATGTATATLATASGQGRLAIAFKPQQSSGLSGTVNQNTETDTSQPIAKSKTKAVSQNTETDTTQIIAPARLYALAQNTEADSAQAVVWSPKNRSVGQIAETDAPQSITSAKIKMLEQNAESETAQPITPATIRLVNQVSETDSAQAVTGSKVYPVSIASETDAAQTITLKIIRLVTQVSEFDESLSMSVGGSGEFLVNVVQVSETDAAQPITAGKVQAIAQTSETDAVQAITSAKYYVVSQIIETDLAQSLFPLKRVSIVQAVEVDTPQAVTPTKYKAIGQTSETDEPQSIAWFPMYRFVGQVVETDLAQAITLLDTAILVELTLSPRTSELTLQSRTGQITLETREPAFTLEER